ncbi:P-loop containing nucleoside triphosphate hydrolase protein, partial [Aureobasidium melanogenum]|uniref:p-loop containing nucleoside triphosphate hydrolase protein n=1 Tax=Aureobasidium melanogenum (strain CBS 110374) TaxID=1043003 RepID=A0A074VYL7_AURM1
MSEPAVSLPPPSAPCSTARGLPPSSRRSRIYQLPAYRSRGPRTISTGLDQLNAILGATKTGGLGRGTITEIWGPSGSGKTSLALQTATHALNNGSSVVWVDATTAFAKSRLNDFLAANPFAHGSEPDQDTRLQRFHNLSTPTVAHLLALTLHPPQSFPSPGTALMVIDDLHAIFEVSYPRNRANTFSSHKSEAARWAAGRRYGIMGTLISALKRLAALNDMAIVVTTGCATRVRPGSGLGAVLVPGMGGAEWEAGISNRLVMFRDFKLGSWAQQQQHPESARYIGLQKNNGVAFSDEGETGQLVAYTIDKDGLKDIVNQDSTADAPVVTLAASSPSKIRKRPYAEIADGTAEGRDEYGWLNGDEADAEGLIDEAALLEDDEAAATAAPEDDTPATIIIDD